MAYQMSRGQILVIQSAEVEHQGTDTLRKLVLDLPENAFMIASVFNVNHRGERRTYTSITRQRPLFFLGSIRREHVFAIGGDSEDFTGPGYEDDWFAQCLTKGLGLKGVYREDIVGYHYKHPPGPGLRNETYQQMKQLYLRKVADAKAGKTPYFNNGLGCPQRTRQGRCSGGTASD